MSRDKLAAILGLKVVPFKGDVFVKKLSLTERLELTTFAIANKDNNALHMAKLAVLATCNEAGERILSDDDFAFLAESDGEIAEQLQALALSHNGYSKDDTAKKN